MNLIQLKWYRRPFFWCLAHGLVRLTLDTTAACDELPACPGNPILSCVGVHTDCVGVAYCEPWDLLLKTEPN